MAKDVGKGTTLGIDLAGGSTYVSVAQIISITPPGLGVEDVVVSTLDSTIVDKIPNDLPEIKSISMELEWDPDLTGHQQFKANVGLRGVSFQVTFPGNTGTNKATVTGYIKEFNPAAITATGSLRSSVVITPTSAITWVD